MRYNHSLEQRSAIKRAMQQANQTDDGKRRYSDQQVIDAINKWSGLGQGAVLPSLPTYSRYRLHGVEDRGFGEHLYRFFSSGPKEFRFITVDGESYDDLNDDQLFVRALQDRFGTPARGYDYRDIQCMAHTYELYRRSWQVDELTHFVRSLLRVELERGVYRLTEIQKFTYGGIEVNEMDKGLLLPYSTNFYAITNSPNCMKFYDFHDFFPEPSEGVSMEFLCGNLMAISGKGPHPSYRIYARRARGAVELGHYSINEFKDKEEYNKILEYIIKIN